MRPMAGERFRGKRRECREVGVTDTQERNGRDDWGVAKTGGVLEEALVIESHRLEGTRAPEVVLIAPWGDVHSVNGRFVVDEEAVRLVVAAYERHATDIPIDYEHQSLGGVYASPTGQAPAAGWIRALRAVSPEDAAAGEAGLLAEVAWTAAAQAKLSAGEYRYLSPVVLVRKTDRRVVGLHSAALTNKPAIVGMRPIVNRVELERGIATVEGDAVVDTGVPDGCVVGGLAAGIEVLRRRLRLDRGSDPVEVLLAADRRLGVLMTEAAEREASAKVAAAMQAGQLAPAQREWAVRLALSDPVAFTEWAASAPAVVMIGRTQPPSGDAARQGRDRAAVIASARASFSAEPDLAALTSESAWVNDALREAGLGPDSEK